MHIVQIPPREHGLDHADFAGPHPAARARSREIGESIRLERSRSWEYVSMIYLSVRGVQVQGLYPVGSAAGRVRKVMLAHMMVDLRRVPVVG